MLAQRTEADLQCRVALSGLREEVIVVRDGVAKESKAPLCEHQREDGNYPTFAKYDRSEKATIFSESVPPSLNPSEVLEDLALARRGVELCPFGRELFKFREVRQDIAV